MILTLRHKVNGAIIITFALISLAVTAIVLPLQKHRFKIAVENINILLETLVQRDTEPLANEIFDNRLKAIAIRLHQMKSVKGILGITLFDHEGRHLVSQGADPAGQEIGPEEIADIRHAPQAIRTQRQGQKILIFSKEIKFLGEELGFIRIEYSLAALEKDQKFSYWIIGGLLAAILFVMLIVLNWILSKAILDPITHLRDAARFIARGNLEKGIDMDRRDELGNLAESFEQMRGAIQEKIHALKHATSLIEATIDSMPSILVGVDKQGRVTQWNRAAFRATGRTAKQARGKPIETALPLLEKEKVMMAIQNRCVQSAARVPRHGHNLSGHPSENQAEYEDVTIYPLEKKGIEGAVIRIDDVTDKVRFEEILIQTEKMMSVGGLAAGMAHEINNPLAGILQNTSVLANRLSKEALPANVKAAKEAGITMDGLRRFMDDRQIPRHLTAITESGRRIASLVDNMLSFARKGDASFSSHAPGQLMDLAISLAATDFDLKRNFDFKSIRIMKEYEKDLPELPCEPSKIQQVLLNILSNGAHAMSATPSPIFILRIAREPGSGMLRIEIEDNGTGMDEFTQKKIFEPFFTTKPVGTGTGLGMSVSFFIITDHHSGTMEVISKPGKGARFIIRLPLKQAF